MSNNSVSGGGISFPGALCLIFIVLKLTDHIDWSWWWVFSPLWGLIPLAIAGLIIWGIYTLLMR